jgi:serine/threonine-protein kinase
MDQWTRVKQIFQSALDRAPQERAAFVHEACRGDEHVRTEVESLLLAHQEAGNFAEQGAEPRDVDLDLIGRQIGSYRILSLIGAGGMGEVYRAHDTKLGREVAIKILPPAFTSDAERRARFEREARVLATMNHPHIGAIYGLEHTGAVQALVLELVAGQTLAERLAKGPLSIADVLAIGRQIADALEAAHEKGVVHRDLKPANIKITPNGTVKVLDFGLAKATGPDLPHSPTITIGRTQEGALLGTAAYMSPEQARGQTVDKRTDIWAFGCVLYEMLTGRVAFDRDTVSDTVAAVIEREPDWSALPPGLSPTLKIYLQRSLQKNPRERVHDIADLRLALEGAFDIPRVEPIAYSAKKSPWRKRSLIAMAAVLVAGLGATTAWLVKSVSSEPPVIQPVARVSIQTHPLALLGRAPSSVIALSPDGSHLAYVAGDRGVGQLYLQRRDSFEATPLAGADDAQGPFFSPDGKWIAFFTEADQLKKVSIAGGLPVPLCSATSLTHGGSWVADDQIIFGGNGGLWRVSGSGGKPELLVPTDSEAMWPEVLPNGDAIVYTEIGPERIWAHSLKTGERRLLVELGSHARYVSSGHLVYASKGLLMAVPFDAERLDLLGPAVPVIEGIMMGLPREPMLPHFAVSASGTLAYLAGPVLSARHTLLWVDRRGREESLNVEPRSYSLPRISPDGTRLAVEVEQSGNVDVWIHDLVRKTFAPLTSDPGDDGRPVWAPDGQRVAFLSTRDGKGINLFWQRVDGAIQAERLTTEPNQDQSPWAFTPDGKMLLFTRENPKTGIDLHLLSLERIHAPKVLVQEAGGQGSPALSPDGRWVAYRSNESGRYEIYVRPFPNVNDGKWSVTADGGSSPVWAPDRRELFYQNGDAMMAIPIDTEPTFTFGKPQRLFSGSYIRTYRNFDISPDGQRFLMIKDAGAQALEPSARDEIAVVLNWSEELKRLAPPK